MSKKTIGAITDGGVIWNNAFVFDNDQEDTWEKCKMWISSLLESLHLPVLAKLPYKDTNKLKLFEESLLLTQKLKDLVWTGSQHL
jgi:hypothetical protein